MWLASKGIVVLIRIPKDIGILVIISKSRRTMIGGAFKLTDALSLIFNVVGNLGNFTKH